MLHSSRKTIYRYFRLIHKNWAIHPSLYGERDHKHHNLLFRIEYTAFDDFGNRQANQYSYLPHNSVHHHQKETDRDHN